MQKYNNFLISNWEISLWLKEKQQKKNDLPHTKKVELKYFQEISS